MLEEMYKEYTRQVGIFSKGSFLRYDEERLVDKYFSPQKNKKLLVLGCGGGRTLIPLHEKGFEVIAIDIVDGMVEAAKRKIGERPIMVKKMDAVKLEFGNEFFDYVIFPFHGIDCVYPDIYACVKEARRVLKKEGIFIFNSHNRYFLKKLTVFFSGKYAKDKDGILLYRTDLKDYFKLRKYFWKVKIKHRISMLPWSKSNWKDKMYKLFPLFSKSTYFICKYPR